MGHLLGSAEAAQRHDLDHHLKELLAADGRGHLPVVPIPLTGVDPAHVQAVHENIVLGQLLSQELGQGDAGRAIGHRGNAVGRRQGPGQGVDVDDAAPFLLAHVRNHRLHEAEMSDLDIVGVVEDVLGLQGLKASALSLAGVVDQHVDPAPGLGDLSRKGAHRSSVAHVQGRRDHLGGPEGPQVFGDGLQGVGAARADRQAHAFPGEGRCDGPTDSAAGAGYDHPFGAEIDMHVRRSSKA